MVEATKGRSAFAAYACLCKRFLKSRKLYHGSVVLPTRTRQSVCPVGVCERVLAMRGRTTAGVGGSEALEVLCLRLRQADATPHLSIFALAKTGWRRAGFGLGVEIPIGGVWETGGAQPKTSLTRRRRSAKHAEYRRYIYGSARSDPKAGALQVLHRSSPNA